jgi:RNA recognition motif-containing protein
LELLQQISQRFNITEKDGLSLNLVLDLLYSFKTLGATFLLSKSPLAVKEMEQIQLASPSAPLNDVELKIGVEAPTIRPDDFLPHARRSRAGSQERILRSESSSNLRTTVPARRARSLDGETGHWTGPMPAVDLDGEELLDSHPLRSNKTYWGLRVTNLPHHVNREDLKALFQNAGTVQGAEVLLNAHGYGTVLFAAYDDASRAIEMFNGYCWQGHILDVRLERSMASTGTSSEIAKEDDLQSVCNVANPTTSGNILVVSFHSCDSRNLSDTRRVDKSMTELPHSEVRRPRSTPYWEVRVANLPHDVGWEDLRSLFWLAGKVVRADVSREPRGYGSVLFATFADASQAMEMFKGYSWQGSILSVHAEKILDFDGMLPEIEGQIDFMGPEIAGKSHLI